MTWLTVFEWQDVIWIRSNDVNDNTCNFSQLIRTVAAMEYLEHDLYWCYVALMKHTHPYYTTDKVNKVQIVDKYLNQM